MDKEFYIQNNVSEDTTDSFRSYRAACLKHMFPEYPDISFDSLVIKFHVNRTSNADILYMILEKFKPENKNIVMNDISVVLHTEQELISFANELYNLVSIIHSWKTISIVFNDRVIKYDTFRHVCTHFFDLHNTIEPSCTITPKELRKKYNPVKKKHSSTSANVYKINFDNLPATQIFATVVDQYKKLFLNNYQIEEIAISNKEIVLLIENEVIIYFYISPYSVHQIISTDTYPNNNDICHIIIQELTYNLLYKFNESAFLKLFLLHNLSIDYLRFRGINTYKAEIDKFQEIQQRFPALDLLNRYNAFPGTTYHFIIFEMKDINGNTEYGIGYTSGAIHKFVLKICSELEIKNSRSLELNGVSSLDFQLNKQFINAFLSWTGKKKLWRLENQFTYCYIDVQIKENRDLFILPAQILNNAYLKKYADLEHGYYSKPVNKWKTEEMVYNIVKKMYSQYQVIYQYRPYFLRTDTGNMSYDVYICGLKIAIEYQGKQHFQPVDFFGGEDNYIAQKKRDETKLDLSRKNGVHLVYINYWDNITPDLIRQRIEEQL